MSLRVVHAGSGYQYLLRSVATNDAYSEIVDGDDPFTALSQYYQAKGTPPGRWLGSGLAGFHSEMITTGAMITAEQMANLYGIGLHPEAKRLWEQGGHYVDAKLGRTFLVSTKVNKDNIPVLVALKKAEKEFISDHQRGPTEDERTALALSVGREFYVEATGFVYASDAKVIGWVNEQQRKVRQAVAGFDMTFSPVKSVSVLWALSDEETASKIASCHHKAVAETMRWVEDNVAFTRVGTNGIEQVKTQGLIASEFTHYDTRAGDPDLHSHVLVSNKVQALDGQWLALDSQEIFRNAQAMSARYDALLMEILRRELGLSFTQSWRADEDIPVWEINGVPAQLNLVFSSRKEFARPIFDQMVNEYREKYSQVPDSLVKKRLWQKAILETRDAKKPAESLETLRAEWLKRAHEVTDGEQLVAKVRLLSEQPVGDRRRLFSQEGMWDEHVSEVADIALAQVTEKRAVFGDHHIETAVATELKGWQFQDQAELLAAQKAIVAEVLVKKAVCISPAELLKLPSRMVNDRAVGVDRRVGRDRYTTEDILAAEQFVLDACEEPVVYSASHSAIDKALKKHKQKNGWELNVDQEVLARSLLTRGSLVACGVGPAGTGKTTSMEVVTKVWQAQGHNVIALAPSAQAAKVLGGEIGAEATTIDKLTFTWRGADPNRPGHDVSALPIDIKSGDMLLVDEAGMASTQSLAALVEIAQASGAVVRMIGDPYQLAAVGCSGLFNTCCNLTKAIGLQQVMRFSQGQDRQQAEASLNIRKGDRSGLNLYEDREWVGGGSRLDMLERAVSSYLDDRNAGRASLLIAATNDDVDVMNQMVREYRQSIGEVGNRVEVSVSRGEKVAVGDVVITRKNKVFYTDRGSRKAISGKVVNGQLFDVVAIHASGDLEVRDQKTKARLVIPARYAQEHVHLGYAATVHRAQGATVDVCHAVIDSAMDRAGLYVSLTRGKMINRCYCVTDEIFDFDAEDAHFHMRGMDEEVTARTVLERALANDKRARSATEQRQLELAESFSRDRVTTLYSHGVDIAMDALVEHVCMQLVDSLPKHLFTLIAEEPEAEAEISFALKRCCQLGVDIREISLNELRPQMTEAGVGVALKEAIIAHDPRTRMIGQVCDEIISRIPPNYAKELTDTDREFIEDALSKCVIAGVDITEIVDLVVAGKLDTADDAGKVLHWRISQFLEDSEPLLAPPPKWVGQDTELARWLDETYDMLTTKPQEVAPKFEKGAVIQGEDFRKYYFVGQVLDGVRFIDCDFRGVDFRSTALRHVTFERCAMDATNFTKSALSRVEFTDSQLQKADFTASHISADDEQATVTYAQCFMERVKFVGAKLTNVVFDECKLLLADFRNIIGDFGFFYRTDVTGSVWDNRDKGGFDYLEATDCRGEDQLPVMMKSQEAAEYQIYDEYVPTHQQHWEQTPDQRSAPWLPRRTQSQGDRDTGMGR